MSKKALLAVPYIAPAPIDPGFLAKTTTTAPVVATANKIVPLSSLATPAPQVVANGSKIVSWTTPSPAYQFQKGDIVNGAHTIDAEGVYLITSNAKLMPTHANTEVTLNLVADDGNSTTVLSYDSATLSANGGGLKIHSINAFPAGTKIFLQVHAMTSATVQAGATFSITRVM